METRTAGSASGLGKRTSSNAGTARQADSTDADTPMVSPFARYAENRTMLMR